LTSDRSHPSENSPAPPRVVLLTSPGWTGAMVIDRLSREPGLALVGIGLTNRVFKNTGLVGTIWRVIRRSGFHYFLYSALESTIAWSRLRGKKRPAALEDAGVSVFAVDDVNSEATHAWLTGLQPEIVLSFYFNQWIGPGVRTVPTRGCVNLHPSLLPALRGPDPVFRAIERGLTATGLTLHDVADEFDAGAIRVQMRSEINLQGTHFANLRWLMQAGADLAAGWIVGRIAETGPVTADDRASGIAAATGASAAAATVAALTTQPSAAQGDYATFPSRREVGRFFRAGHRLLTWSEFRQDFWSGELP
jgi:methionyl-tRNA formyltransferase